MINYSGVLFLLYVIISSVLVVSIVVFSCTDHPEYDKASKKKKKIKPKSNGTSGSTFVGTADGIIYTSGVGGAACGGGNGGGAAACGGGNSGGGGATCGGGGGCGSGGCHI